jgi:excisionase family DNA binding protein
MRPNREPIMLSPIEVATTLNVSEETIRRRIRSGAIRSVRIGRRVLVHRDEVAVLAEHGLPPPPTAAAATVPAEVA